MNELTFAECSREGALWLAQQQQEDGSIGAHCGIRGFYKAVLALTRAGLPGHANRLLSWIKTHAMPAPGVISVAPENRVTGQESLYRSLWVLRGAVALNRFDLASQDALARVMEHQDSSGGFRPFLSGPGNQIIDPTVTSLAGWLCLDVRSLEQAGRAGEHLVGLLDLQPAARNIFYYKFDADRKALVTETPSGQDINMAVDPANPRQPFFHWGAAMGFLSDLYCATGCETYLRGAERYFAWSSRICRDGYRWPPICKSGWGAALLFSVTHKPEHRAHAESVAQTLFLEGQLAEGNWPAFHYSVTQDGSERVELPSEEITAEFAYELLEIAKGLAA